LFSIVAAGQMLVVITRNIDLSVASVIGLAVYASADMFRIPPVSVFRQRPARSIGRDY
jgi:rhamnose transport system ATP-binding protein